MADNAETSNTRMRRAVDAADRERNSGIASADDAQASTVYERGAVQVDREKQHGWIELRCGGTLIVLHAKIAERPRVIYSGTDLPGASAFELAQLATHQHAPGTPSIALNSSFLNDPGTGLSGPVGIRVHREGYDWAVDLKVTQVEHLGECAIAVHCSDAETHIASVHTFTIDPATGVTTINTAITNTKGAALDVEWCASLCLPLEQRFDRLVNFTGRWSGEFAIEEIQAFNGSVLRENRAGRTSHDAFPGGIAATARTSQTDGSAVGYHLAWSGNHRLQIDRHRDGRSFVQMGELPFAGEIRLDAGETYQTPDMLLAWSEKGLNGVSQAFHDHLRRNILDERGLSRIRPVHYNTWEAVYFDHSEETLLALAETASEVGAERFVVDDGWFGGRRHDRAGLGDWWVSPEVFPEGLLPVAKRVRALGMEFGIWFEPEMVNPDSELYRQHPEWVLGAPGRDPVPYRGQLTLDLTREEVCEYLFGKISAVVSELGVAYIKWDMNRDTHFPGSEGRAVMHRQVTALYALLERLRSAHPDLEIESCASGGARADFGVLQHTDRIWTSDNNDARTRQHIIRGASHFLPLSVLGNHVGPKTCHITGRKFTMAFRVASAFFGHMGMELDLREESAEDLAILKAGIALHKKHRALLHEGVFVRLDSAPLTNAIGCVSRDQGEALFTYAKLEDEVATLPARLRFAGLDPALRYRVQMVWPLANPSLSAPSIVEAADLMGEGAVFSGAALMEYGIQPPLTHPDTALVYHLRAED